MPVLAHARGPFEPLLRREEGGSRATKREPVEPLGSLEASHIPTAPPIERPQNETRSSPSSSSSDEHVAAEVVDRIRPRRNGRAGRGRAGRSARSGIAQRGRASAAPTSRASCRASYRGRAHGASAGPSRTRWSLTCRPRAPRRTARAPGRPCTPAEPRYVVGSRAAWISSAVRPVSRPASSSASDRPVSRARSEASRTSVRAAVRPRLLGEDERDSLGERSARR